MLKVKNLVKIYKIGKTKETVKALNNVSIDFPETGLVFLLGKSGSGKSTLLNAIGGLDTFNSGEIIIKGKSSKDFSQSDFDSYRNTFIGFIFQEYNVLEEFSVAKNLSIALELQGKKADREAVNNLLSQVDMLPFAKRKPNQLSGGQKQRVAIARALIKNPEIIMADEPTGALDSNTGKQVMDTLKKLSETKLVIIVSHDREFAEIYGDRIIELKDGKIIQDVTKKEIESRKTDSGVSIIDDKIIHIKKGIQLTNDDLNKITSVLKTQTAHSDVIISIDENANDQVKKANFITDEGNKEAFVETLPEDVVQKNYDPKNFKLIKSQLKFKDSFKMGASALKNKVGKLVFTILLSFIAFTMFGVIDTVSTFNRASAVFHTVDQFNKKTVSILKEEKGEWSNDTVAFKEEDVRAIKHKFPDIDIKRVVGANIRFGNNYYSDTYSKTLRIGELNNSSNNPSLIPYFSGMTHVTEQEMAELGLSFTSGRLPVEDNEIAISKHIFDAAKALNTNENITEESLLTTHKTCSTWDGTTYTIVGIIDDGSDYSEYMNMSSAEVGSDYMLQQKIARELDFGFSNMCYISQNHYENLLNKPTNLSLYVSHPEYESHGNSVQLNELTTLADAYYKYSNGYINEFVSNSRITYKNGSIYKNNAFVNLNDNEVIIYKNHFDNLFNTDDSNREATLQSSTPLTFGVYEYNYTDDDYTTLIATYTAVGYYNSSSSNFMYCNSNTITELNNAKAEEYEYLKFKNGANVVGDPIWALQGYTIEEKFNIDYSWVKNKEEYVDFYIDYYKVAGANGNLLDGDGNFIELGENEVILSKWSLSGIAQDEELENLIQNGLTVNLTKDYEGESTVISLKVVGVTSDYSSEIYTSSATLDGTLGDLLSGFDYAIAILSDNSKTNEDFIKYCETFNNLGYKFTVQTGATPILDQFGDTLEEVAEVLLYVGIGFAVFAALLLMNFISTSISYKKREIGILRALGARGSDVFGIFFNESAVIALINFALATIATIVTSIILNNVIITKLGLDLVLLSVGIRQILLLFGVSMGTAFLSSFLPVMKIARKKPIDAINNR